VYKLDNERSMVASFRQRKTNGARTDFSSLSYRGHRFTASGFHQKSSRETSELKFETAVVFADGHWGITRPVSDSFAILYPHASLRGHQIDFEPGSSIDWMGNGVVQTMRSYRLNEIMIESARVPIGTDLGKGVYYLLPRFGAGYAIKVGMQLGIFVRGTLLDRDGAPVYVSFGQMRRVGEAGGTSKAFFTNKAGRFQLSGLQAGKYEVQLLDLENKSFILEVPAGKAGLLDVGTVRLQ